MCLDLGKCKDGKCIPFCEREQQLESCACNGEHVPPPPPRGSLPLAAAGCAGLRGDRQASGLRSGLLRLVCRTGLASLTSCHVFRPVAGVGPGGRELCG